MTPGWWALGGVAAVLSGLIALEAMPAPREAPASGAAPAMPSPPAAIRAPALPDDALVAAILARPLFAPDRRPDVEASTARAGLPRLAGIVFVPGNAFGIFQADEKAKPVTVADGGSVGGCGIGPIERDRVTLTCNGTVHVLRPSYLNALATKPIPITRLSHAKRADPAWQP